MERKDHWDGLEGLSPVAPGPSDSSARPARPQQGPSLRWPEWGPAILPAPWWEDAAYPCVSIRAIRRVVDTEPAESAGRRIEDRFWGKTAGGGGVTTMARILGVLSALASLFLIAGASAKY
ncbi:MAG: hypothetical protein WDA27_01800 [Actinomycetota bacterium]